MFSSMEEYENKQKNPKKLENLEAMTMKNYIIISRKIVLLLIFLLCLFSTVFSQEKMFGISLDIVYSKTTDGKMLNITFDKTTGLTHLLVKNLDSKITFFSKIYLSREKPFRPLILYYEGRYFILLNGKVMIFNCIDGLYSEMDSVYESAMYLSGTKLFIEPAYDDIEGIDIDFITLKTGLGYSKNRPFEIKTAMRADSPVSIF